MAAGDAAHLLPTSVTQGLGVRISDMVITEVPDGSAGVLLSPQQRLMATELASAADDVFGSPSGAPVVTVPPGLRLWGPSADLPAASEVRVLGFDPERGTPSPPAEHAAAQGSPEAATPDGGESDPAGGAGAAAAAPPPRPTLSVGGSASSFSGASSLPGPSTTATTVSGCTYGGSSSGRSAIAPSRGGYSQQGSSEASSRRCAPRAAPAAAAGPRRRASATRKQQQTRRPQSGDAAAPPPSGEAPGSSALQRSEKGRRRKRTGRLMVCRTLFGMRLHNLIWKERFVAVGGGALTIHRREGDGKPQQTVPVSEIQCVGPTRKDVGGRDYCFAVVTRESIITFQARNTEHCQQWCDFFAHLLAHEAQCQKRRGVTQDGHASVHSSLPAQPISPGAGAASTDWLRGRRLLPVAGALQPTAAEASPPRCHNPLRGPAP
eukprot:TRINITY_DN14182_c0_g1_i2.p1 TRINITY_DN14182_c0_g1~~TRINITY_DN14182_c0_g1_i2.p1  ORF type:complete len:476 (+),score=84.81 TRINITY_DN14182_c0_g1_i2:125-1429(+)